ncbi:iron ABC transporter ATP-binding protein [Snodgrassella alvi]|uniref:iron ABC transporter ATP-binding protein n=1 Tax=Snodgrassella alvi TaxID=1196083 RepID=UPI000C1EE5CF|nr:ATP-binding cassette domain-containing protein [Snodgrassella alvi]PIT36276.1 iron ABC transporter ATP-binding protein [Snodgrassella alvi]
MISIKNVNYCINGATILRDINLDIPDKSITALIGPNGAGKSTLFSLIARLQPLQQGSIHIDELDVSSSKSNAIAQKLAILSQENNIQSRITVRDLLLFGRYPHNQGRITNTDQQIVDQALQRFELQELQQRYLSALSGGQRQRALVAMTFCQQTKHVILDEPLNNLDMYHARELMRLLRELTSEQGLSTVMVVHDINMAAAYADHIVALKEGQIVMQGSPDKIITADNIQTIFNLDTEVLSHKGKPLVIHHL